MQLSIPIEPSQIEAAKRLHGRLQQWRLVDEALAVLSEQLPGFTTAEALLKVTVINALYGTNVYAIVPMARHVAHVLEKLGPASLGAELVEVLASIPRDGDKKYPFFRSFASKFAHFFIDAERFPIMDSYSMRMVKMHLGKGNYAPDGDHPYLAFFVNHGNLKAEIDFKGSNRDLDRYLWLSGEYLAWQKNHEAAINAELRVAFEKPSPEVAADLDALVAPVLSKVIRGSL
jgi:hypothetical protein